MPFINDQINERRRASAANDEGGSPASGISRLGRIGASAVADRLEAQLFGQAHAIASVERALAAVQAGLSDPYRPLASHLLVGPTGTGKTELVRQVASALRRDADDFCQIDMAGMAQEHYASAFSGAPPGYAGSKDNLTIFNREQIQGDLSMPGIALFDEVEKAHPTVLRALLAVLDRGVLILANGEQRISFRNTLIFMTSNIGTRSIRELQQSRRNRAIRGLGKVFPGINSAANRSLRSSVDDVTMDAVEEFFDPEFLNRIDEVCVFKELDSAAAVHIVRKELTAVQQRASRSGVSIRWDSELEHYLVNRGFDPVYGARSLRREIRHSVWPVIAESVIERRRTSASDESVEVMLAVRSKSGESTAVHAETSSHA